MSDKPYNEPAFPVLGTPGAPEDYPGMSLRDYFAAQALPGLIAEPMGHLRTAVMLAEGAYEIADAMLAARAALAQAGEQPL